MLYRVGDCELDAACFELRRGGRSVPVEPQVLELLLYLVAHRDRAVTRSELFENLWRGRVVGDSALNSRIKAARAALGDDGASQAMIRTLHRTGYRFVAAVEEVAAPSPAEHGDHAPAPAIAVVSTPRKRQRGRLGLVGAAAAAALTLGAFALLPLDTAVGPPARQPTPIAETRNTDTRKTLAVLPFANLSTDADQDYFADGISVELLGRLSQLPDLRLTGRISSSYFKDPTDPLPLIAAKLGVAHLLTGSVRKSGDHARIAVELIDAASGYQIWSNTYDRELGDIFSVQDDIAASVATALQVKLGLGENAELGMTRDVAAYDAFLRGIDAYSKSSFDLAIDHMHRALALDPSFSRAWAYLYCIYLEGSFLVPAHSVDWATKASEALAHARDLAPDSPFVKILEARENMRYGKQIQAYKTLEDLPPGYWTADRFLTKDVFSGRFLLSGGYAKEAVASLQRSRATDPLSPVAAAHLATAYAAAGDTNAALAETDRIVALGHSSVVLHGNAMLVALATHDRDEIRKRVRARDGGNPDPINEAMLEHLDDAAAARAELRRIAALPAQYDFLRTVVIAHWAAYFDDPELALEQLRTIAHGNVDEGLLWRPVLASVRRLPAFKDLVREQRLVDYWRAHGWPDLCRPTMGDDFECS